MTPMALPVATVYQANGSLQASSAVETYRPGLVTQIVDGVQGVDGRDAAVLQADHQVAEVLILGHAEGVLTDEDKVGPEGPGERQLGVWE